MMKPDLHERIAAIWGETVTAVTAPRTVDEMARRIIQDRIQLALQRGGSIANRCRRHYINF